MAYDPATATVLLFGGTSTALSAVVPLDETWSWNSTAWTRLSPAGSPPLSGGASMAYDPGTEALLLVDEEEGAGDYTNGYGQLNDTWTLTAPSRPSGH